MKLHHANLCQWILGAINALLSIFLALEAYLSLQWQIMHDGPILFYMGWLEQKLGYIPYRDFFDMNMPGAHWISALLGTVFGFNNPGYRHADLFMLGVLLFLIFLWLRSYSFLSAWSGAVVFGLVYLQYGQGMSLQREFLILPFLMAAFLIFPLLDFSTKPLMLVLAGIALGLAAIIKPQAGLMFLVFIPVILFSKQTSRQIILSSSLFTLGCAFPFLASLLYLGLNHALPAFIETATRYWPLYNAINGRLEINTSINPMIGILDGLKSVGLPALWLLPAGFAIFSGSTVPTQTRGNQLKYILIAGAAVACLLGVIIANKYWEYHWLPFIFFLILISAAGLASISTPNKQSSNWAAPVAFLFVVIILLRPSNEFWLQISGQPLPPPQGGRVSEIADYLEKNLEPGDAVQPLDWSSGAVHAMLVARAVPATRYLYDFHFYHHISNPEIQFLRQDILTHLTESKPKIIIQFVDGRPWVNGPDSTRDFPELRQFIDENYYLDRNKNGYQLWQRN